MSRGQYFTKQETRVLVSALVDRANDYRIMRDEAKADRDLKAAGAYEADRLCCADIIRELTNAS